MSHPVTPARVLLVALMLLLVGGAPLAYPASALASDAESGPLDAGLGMDIAWRVERNLSSTHPYLESLARLASLESSASPLSEEPEQVPQSLDAIMYLSADSAASVIRYLQSKVYLVDPSPLDENSEKLLAYWDSSATEPAKRDLTEPGRSVLGGFLEHPIVFHVSIGQAETDIDEGAGDPDKIRDAFLENMEYKIQYLLLAIDDNGQLVAVPKTKDLKGRGEMTATVRVKDYSVLAAFAIQPSFKPGVLGNVNNPPDKEGGYYYYATAKVSFTVTITPGAETVDIASYSTSDRDLVEVDVTSYVRAAIAVMKNEVRGLSIPSHAKQDLLDILDDWYSETYKVVTKHFVVDLIIELILKDYYTVYVNGTKERSGEDTLASFENYPVIGEVDEQSILEEALKKADEKLSKYYPEGLEAFTYQPDYQGSTLKLIVETPGEQEGETQRTEQDLQPGQPSQPVEAFYTTLALSTYPASAEAPVTQVKWESTIETTKDYDILPTSFAYGSTSYTKQYERGDSTITEEHDLRLFMILGATVKKVDARVWAELSRIDVYVGVTPKIVAKKAEPVVEGSPRLIPALAPLGGYGILSELAGAADQVGFSGARSIVEAVSGFLQSHRSMLSYVMPLYMPIPMPHKSLQVFAPGEFIGAYYVTQTVGIGNWYRAVPGVGVASLIYEHLDLELKKQGVDPDKDDPTVYRVYYGLNKEGKIVLTKDERDSATLFSFGFGVGSISGKRIGARLYMAPSSNGTLETPPGIIKDLATNIKNLLDRDDIIGELIKSMLPKEIRDKVEDLSDQLGASGVYPQITPYLTDIKSVWPFMMISTKNSYRFVVTEPGDYTMSASLLFLMVHVKVVKIPLIGLPVPIPLFIWHSESAQQEIMVRQIGVLPLLVHYDIQPPDKLGEAYGKGSSVGIYAAPVWLDLDGNPFLPVLLRGRYGTGPGSTGLTVVLVDSEDRVITGEDVQFYGLPASFIRVPLDQLERLMAGRDEATVKLVPAWKAGLAPGYGDYGFEPVEIRLARLKTLPLFYLGDRLIAYTGVYEPGNKIHELAQEAQDKAQEIADALLARIEEARGIAQSILDGTTSLQEVLNVLTANQTSLSERLSQIGEQLTADIIAYAYSVVINLGAQLVFQGIKAVILAAIPDPTGVVTWLIDEATTAAMDWLTSLLDVKEINIVEVVRRYAVEALTLVAVSVAVNLLGESGVRSLLSSIQGLVERVLATLDAAENAIRTVLRVIENIVELTVYKPVLVSMATAYSLDGGSLEARSLLTGIASRNADTISPTNAVLAIDALQLDTARGAIIVTAPYSTISFAIDLILGRGPGEAPNVAVSVQDTLRLVAAWANLASMLATSKQTADRLQDFSNNLQDLAETVENGLGSITPWVEIPGLTTETILMPGETLIPPSKI